MAVTAGATVTQNCIVLHNIKHRGHLLAPPKMYNKVKTKQMPLSRFVEQTPWARLQNIWSQWRGNCVSIVIAVKFLLFFFFFLFLVWFGSVRGKIRQQ